MFQPCGGNEAMLTSYFPIPYCARAGCLSITCFAATTATAAVVAVRAYFTCMTVRHTHHASLHNIVSQSGHALAKQTLPTSLASQKGARGEEGVGEGVMTLANLPPCINPVMCLNQIGLKGLHPTNMSWLLDGILLTTPVTFSSISQRLLNQQGWNFVYW